MTLQQAISRKACTRLGHVNPVAALSNRILSCWSDIRWCVKVNAMVDARFTHDAMPRGGGGGACSPLWVRASLSLLRTALTNAWAHHVCCPEFENRACLHKRHTC